MTGLDLREEVWQKARELTELLVNSQKPNGAWCYCFENGTLTDAYLIILLRHLGLGDEILINRLARRIISKQQVSGVWKLFDDQPEGDLSATIECYYALLLAGVKMKSNPAMHKARDFILAGGGLDEAGSLTKIMLALTGNYPWDKLPAIPAGMILLPKWSPVNFFDLVGYTRVHSAPILVCANKKFSLKLPGGPDLSEISSPAVTPAKPLTLPGPLAYEMEQAFRKLPFPLKMINKLALAELENFMLDRTEGDGTLYSYFTSTFLMIFALLALGYEKGHPVITKAVQGLKAMIGFAGDNYHQQETTSTIWDTALIAYALQQAGLACDHPVIVRAAAYLWKNQQTRYGDWRVHNPEASPGGWGFSHSNTINPDVDDTSYALRALYAQAKKYPETLIPLWGAGFNWLLGMQNDDGGWPAFEKNTDKKWPDLLPLPDAKPVLTGPSSADLTGRTLEFLGSYAGMSFKDARVKAGVRWLLHNQSADGSWYGRWGIAYIYGTWAAVTGLIAVGLEPGHRAIQKGVNWLLSIQNPDGGWGESCLSDSERRYIPLGFSTVSQTAWTLDALIAAGLRESETVRKGLRNLLLLLDKNGLETTYPTGAGLPGGFYIHYHSYRYVWPLMTCGHFLKG